MLIYTCFGPKGPPGRAVALALGWRLALWPVLLLQVRRRRLPLVEALETVCYPSRSCSRN